jgi:hypothetical protein
VGVVSPILFLYGIQLRAIPGQARTRPCCPVLACTHRVSPFHRILPLCISELTQHLVPSRHRPYSRWLGRIIANGSSCIQSTAPFGSASTRIQCSSTDVPKYIPQLRLKTCSVLPKLQPIRLRLMSLRRLLCYVFNFSTKLHSAKCTVVFLNFIKMKNCSFIRT